MTTNTNLSRDPMRYLVPALLSTLMTLIALSPIAYVINRNMPQRVVSVDLQTLIEEEQQNYIKLISNGGEISSEERSLVNKQTVNFAKRLSEAVDELGKECKCVIVNKAALLGGSAEDYTGDVRARIK